MVANVTHRHNRFKGKTVQKLVPMDRKFIILPMDRNSWCSNLHQIIHRYDGLS